MSLLLLLAGLAFAMLFLLIWAALEHHPTPSLSGMLPTAYLALVASPACLVLALIVFLIERFA